MRRAGAGPPDNSAPPTRRNTSRRPTPRSWRRGGKSSKLRTPRISTRRCGDLSALRDELANRHPGWEPGALPLDAALHFTIQWQTYLAALEAGRLAAARELLVQLGNSTQNNGGGDPFFPRSEVLARLRALPDPNEKREIVPPPAPPPFESVLDRLKTLDDTALVLRELARHRNEYGRESELNNILTELDKLQQAYRQYQAGLPVRVELERGGNLSAPGIATTLGTLRAQLVRLTLPRALGLPETTRLREDETVVEFLRNTVAEARKNGEWTRLARTLEVSRQLAEAPFGMTSFPAESRGFDAFFAAQNQERAGQWQLAVTSYQTALREGGVNIPSAFIGDRLAAVGKEHPAEFAEAMRLWLNPPQRQGYEFGPFGPSGQPFGPPGQPVPPAALAVPAAAPARPTPAP